MNHSVAFQSALDWLFTAGLKKPAAFLANAALAGRQFEIDSDGDWVNVQPEAVMVSPRPMTIRYELLKKMVFDEWLYRWSPNPTDIVVDLGAGLGDEALALSKLVGRVISVEAHPTTFRALRKTVERSRRTNVTAIHAAAASSDGRLSITDNSSYIANDVMGGGQIEVPARSLQSLCTELGIEHIDFLKMNIEGAEALALEGLGDVSVGIMAIGCHDFMGAQYATRERVIAFMEKRGMTVEGRSTNPCQDTVWGHSTNLAAA